MFTIYKYPLKITDEQILQIPGYNGLISVIEQNGQLMVYSFVNTDVKDVAEIKVAICGTGNSVSGEIKFNWNFLGTVSTKAGFVWHIFYTTHWRYRVM